MLQCGLDELDQLTPILRAGGVIAYPTESVFGLGCDPTNERAVLKILSLKQRSVDQGLLLVAESIEQALLWIDGSRWPSGLPGYVLSTWPGPSTWIFPAASGVPRWLTGRHASIAIRVSAYPTVARLCSGFGGALVSTSANPHGEPPARDHHAVVGYFPAQLDGLVTSSVEGRASPSTIRDAITGRVVRA